MSDELEVRHAYERLCEGGEAVKFRKKPVVVEAAQWFDEYRGQRFDDDTPLNAVVLRRHPWTGHGGPCTLECAPAQPVVETLEGPHVVTDGDWIIRGVAGEFYPCKPDLFAATYERVEEEKP